MDTITKVHNGAARFVEVPRGGASAERLPRLERQKRLGDWALHGVVRRDFGHASVRKVANAESTGAAGGFLVPSELMVGVDVEVFEESFFHKRACFQPMLSETLLVPSADPAQGATGVSPLLGGFTMAWEPEAVSPPASNPAFQMITLTARNCGGIGYASKELVEDGGVALGAYLENLFVKAAVFSTTFACFQGNGVQRPLGVINGPGTATVTRTSANRIKDADVQGMAAVFLPACYPHGWWCVSPSAAATLSTLSGYQPNTLMENAGRGLMGCLLGLPVFCTECLPALGTAGDIVLLDPRLYVLGQRLGIMIEWAPDEPTAFARYQEAFRVWVRVDGQPLWRTTATIADGGTGFSPYVILSTV